MCINLKLQSIEPIKDANKTCTIANDQLFQSCCQTNGEMCKF
jgi:hypothetical protein